MAKDIDVGVLNELYNQYLQEHLLPLLQRTINKSCEVGGTLWEYLSGLVVAGVDAYVYGVYKPKLYHRRSRRGGLGDPKNVRITPGELLMDGNKCHFEFEFHDIAGPGPIDHGSGGTGMIEEDVLGGTNYRYAHKDIHKQFSIPRNFYAIYEENYSPDIAGEKIASGIIDQVTQIMYDAATYAIQTATKE